MTEREKIKTIMQMGVGRTNLGINEESKIISKSLEKQIPQTLVCIEDKFLHCPCCDEALCYKWEKYPTEEVNLNWLKFCWNCGQALKWE